MVGIVGTIELLIVYKFLESGSESVKKVTFAQSMFANW